jgi:hypothetical protein
MKTILLIISIAVGLMSTACKLETSFATPNSNADANRTVDSTTTNNQEPKSNCSLTAAAAAVVEGLKLGASPEEILATLPGSKDAPEVKSGLAKPASPFGVSEFIVRADKLQPKEKFTNISHFTFGLLDGRVSSISIGYKGPAYSHVDEFVTQFVKGTNLPPADQWQAYPGMDTQLKMLICKDFEVRIFTGGEGGNQNYVLLKDLVADKKLKDRRAKARAQASPTP